MNLKRTSTTVIIACSCERKGPTRRSIFASYLSTCRNFWLDKGGAREKEWNNIIGTGSVKIHRGAKARELRRQYANRIIPSRWHEKWKDMGDEFDNGLKSDLYPKHLGAKSRWILQGCHGPDIENL